jgi:hypothetical protein
MVTGKEMRVVVFVSRRNKKTTPETQTGNVKYERKANPVQTSSTSGTFDVARSCARVERNDTELKNSRSQSFEISLETRASINASSIERQQWGIA